jgi:uncharacterized lipoprotein YehR (DUF1307 family)
MRKVVLALISLVFCLAMVGCKKDEGKTVKIEGAGKTASVTIE